MRIKRITIVLELMARNRLSQYSAEYPLSKSPFLYESAVMTTGK